MGKKLTNEEFIRRVKNVHEGYIVRGQYVDRDHKVTIECDKGHIWDANPKPLWNGTGCPYCAGLRIWVGETDLWTVRPDIAKLLKNPSDGYECGRGTHRKAIFICPECGRESLKGVSDVCTYGFSCPFCSDGISFPNKFGRAFLDQLPVVNLLCEYQPNWAKPYRYDNYFEYSGKQYILEMDGEQHYIDKSHFDKTLYERQQIDVIKTNLAIQHGIQLIRIDCMNSEYEYIKNSILQSELIEIFDLSDIDWEMCYQNSQKNKVKEACNLYMSGIHSTMIIAERIHVCRHTVLDYLKRGKTFGWCDYDTNKSTRVNGGKWKQQVALVDECNTVIRMFESITSCVTYMKSTYDIIIYKNAVSDACKTHKPYKGFNFRFANETTQNY